ncbi:MAG: peptide deformylase [Acidimicrobiia bacterium]|nr:peptide deformylase [Acidimicrobiia bacterium]
MTTYSIRTFGDPVLRRPTAEVTEIDGAFAKIVGAMYETMYEAPGVGLAAPQVGVQQQFFVYDIGEGPSVLVNPVIVSGEGEWVYEEGCLSLPGLAFEISRPKLVTVKAIDLDGNEVIVEGDEMLGRVFLHEIDHLQGVLMLDHLDPDERKLAMKMLREQAFAGSVPGAAVPRSDHAL